MPETLEGWVAVIGGIVAVMVVMMGAIMVHIHMLIEVKLTRRDREWRKWAEEWDERMRERFDTLDNHVQSPVLADRIQALLIELQRRGKL